MAKGLGKIRNKLSPYFAHGGFDVVFLALVLILLTTGVIMMFSASYTYCYYNFDGDSFHYFKNQAIFAAVGVFAMLAVSKFDFKFYKIFAKPLLFFAFLLLVIVLIVPSSSGFHRWLSIPGLGSFQPSEVAKFALIFYLACHIGDNYRGINSDEISVHSGRKMKTKIWCLGVYLFLIAAMSVLIYMENHVSGTVIVFALGVFMLWLAGFDYRVFLFVGIVGVIVVIAVISNPEILPTHAQSRIYAWLDKDYDPLGSRWQTNNALYAISLGGFFGVGLGNSTQKQLYVSEPQNDFIFSIVCEELGFFGALVIIGLFIALVIRGFYIAFHTRDKFASLLVMGISFQVGLQAAINIAVVTDVFPNTGISLPFFSYGGTSLLMLLFEMGLVLGVSRYANFKRT